MVRLSQQAREIFDEPGFPEVKIFASGGFAEFTTPKIFWVFLALFEIVFGSLVFIVTRSYYRDQSVSLPTVVQDSRALGMPGSVSVSFGNDPWITRPKACSEIKHREQRRQ